MNFLGALRVPGSGIVNTENCDDAACALLSLFVLSGIIKSGNGVGDAFGDDGKDSSIMSTDEISILEDVSDGVEGCDRR